MTTQLKNCCFWSCARRRENGKCPRENGSMQRHSSLFYSANASFRRDRATGPAHKIPDTPPAIESERAEGSYQPSDGCSLKRAVDDGENESMDHHARLPRTRSTRGT